MLTKDNVAAYALTILSILIFVFTSIDPHMKILKQLAMSWNSLINLVLQHLLIESRSHVGGVIDSDCIALY